jgi:hypothetical protein
MYLLALVYIWYHWFTSLNPSDKQSYWRYFFINIALTVIGTFLTLKYPEHARAINIVLLVASLGAWYKWYIKMSDLDRTRYWPFVLENIVLQIVFMLVV